VTSHFDNFDWSRVQEHTLVFIPWSELPVLAQKCITGSDMLCSSMELVQMFQSCHWPAASLKKAALQLWQDSLM